MGAIPACIHEKRVYNLNHPEGKACAEVARGEGNVKANSGPFASDAGGLLRFAHKEWL